MPRVLHYSGPLTDRPAATAVPAGTRYLDTDTGTEHIENAGTWVTQRAGTLTDTTTATNTLAITPTANKGTSTSTGGALNVTNTGSTGAGVVVFTNRGADAAGRLMALRSANAAFSQSALHVDYLGTNHAVTIAHAGTGAASLALSVTSTNPSDTALGVTGACDGRGTVKITHNKTGADGNASILSCLINGAGTACQGIFLDTASGVTTTGKLINLRQNGTEVFVVHPDGAVQVGNGPGWYHGTGSPEGVKAAAVGSFYSRTDGGTGTTFYVKETGGTGNTGWVAK